MKHTATAPLLQKPSLEEAPSLKALIEQSAVDALVPSGRADKKEPLEHYESSMAKSYDLAKVSFVKNNGPFFRIATAPRRRSQALTLQELRDNYADDLKNIRLTSTERNLMAACATMPAEALQDNTAVALKMEMPVFFIAKIQRGIERKIAELKEKPIAR